MRSLFWCCLATICLLSVGPDDALCQGSYATYQEAMRAAAKPLSMRDFAGSRAPLEAALQLADTDKQRVEVYEKLFPAYREIPESEKLVEAGEYVIQHCDDKTKRSLVTRSMSSFYHQRGLVKGAIERYEETLRRDKGDLVSLLLLTSIYQNIERNAPKGDGFATRLAEVETALDSAKAKRLEEQAAANPSQQAALYKDAGLAWLDAGNIEQAVAAAEKSLAAPPENRGDLMTYFWRQSLGDIFAKAGDTERAITQYESSKAAAPGEVLKKSVQTKIDALNKPK